ncbi:glycoside hydrolase domain-containing protein [Streptomyces sp. NPDC002701]|uniref:glycoside hydrolase domain-containing protein n=1 Tax=Streptomyces sp. NPDC002701 TaxID=3364661 RepID=UPI00368E844C
MADEMVRLAQRFVNSAYGERLIGMTVAEDGRTRWEVMYALTRALQYELGITTLSDSFGPTTLSTLQSKFPQLNAVTVPSANFARIIQSALYCKGYDGGEIDGVYNARVEAAMSRLKRDMGVDGAFPGSDLTPKVFKGLLTMDAYITVNDGSDAIRTVQQWLNSRYVNRRDFFVVPCDGHNSRDVAKSLLFSIQYELGMADGTANGVFGPGTQAGLRSHPVSTGSQGVWVSLFSAAMILNKRQTAFTSSFGSALADEVRAFQSFVKLPVSGGGDFSTWASLLVSYGDQSRKGEACDGVTRITPARAAALKAEGISIVGRYLTSVSSTPPEKVIQEGELRTIAENGLRCFPIYQTVGRDASQYSYPLGRAAGYAAMNAAMDHGFQNGTRIFFAVDFDALDHEVTSSILPHFKGIQDSMADAGDPYQIGVYGPRNVCTRVGAAGHSTASFVSDMSSGFSGNYGYSLPPDWAYDQFVTRWVGAGDGRIEIDNNIVSGRDRGQNTFNPPRPPRADTRLHNSLLTSMLVDIGKYMQSIGFSDSSPLRFFSHQQCFEQIMSIGDDVITEVSNRHSMRKALIQTSAYWEMRHIGPEDQVQDDRVRLYHNGLPGGIRDSSTGIAQITGNAGLRAWNHCIGKGYVSGTVRNPDHDPDLYTIWNQVQDAAFALRTVALIHLWDAEGKPGGNNPEGGETVLRPMALDYNDREIFQVLRRYQGFGDEAEAHARQRLGLYYVCEKYNSIARNM